MYELKNYRGAMCHDNEEWHKIWRRIDLLFQNWHEEFDEFWSEHSKVSKVCTLLGFFWPKHIIFGLRKLREVIFHNTEEWCKNLKKNWLVVWEMTGAIWQIFTRALERFKIGTLMGSFCPNQKMHELKIYRGVICQDN